jgi:DNA-binding MarR family transcriptional regulator
MSETPKTRSEKISARRAREEVNIFARMPAAYAASRSQSQKLLNSAGGLSVLEWRVLWDLAETGPLSIREMAEIQRVDHSQLSRGLPQMQRKGLVTMQRDETDGRQLSVALTDKGRAAYDTAAPIMKRRRDALRRSFTPQEIKQFTSYFDRLEEFLRQPIDDLLTEDPQS